MRHEPCKPLRKFATRCRLFRTCPRPGVSAWLHVLASAVRGLRQAGCYRGYMPWILWVTLLLVLMVATATYSAYRRDLAAARERALSGSRFQETGCGPIEYGTFGEGSPILVLHGTSGGWDQGIAAARGLVGHGFQLIAPSRFGYLRTP